MKNIRVSDIDAVSMVVYDIDDNGILQLWSPYASLNNTKELEISMQLPFPTNKKIEFTDTKDIEQAKTFFNDIGQYLKIRKFDDGKIKVSLNAFRNSNGLLAIKRMLEYKLIFKNRSKKFVDFLKDNKYIDFNIKNLDELDQIYDGIANIIDRHNLYLNGLPKYKLDLIINNLTVNSLYNVIKDPANLVEAQTPVDISTEPLKEIANDPNLPASKRLQERTPGNSENKLESIFENQEGKDCIAISAVGIKGFTALTLYNNKVLSSGDSNAQQLLVGKVGDTKTLLANIRAKDAASITNQDVLDLLISVKDNAEDLALVLSALLSLSTDNAKELSLAKLNAGSLMISCYLYGIAIGMDFREVSRLMMGKTGLIMRRVLDANLMQGNPGYSRLKLAFDYFDKGPNKFLSKYDTSYFAEISQTNYGDEYVRVEKSPLLKLYDHLNSVYGVKSENGINAIKRFIENRIINGDSLENVLELFDSFKNHISLQGKDVELFNQLIDFCKEYAFDRYNLDDRLYNRTIFLKQNPNNAQLVKIKPKSDFDGDYEKLKYLCEGAEEMRKLGLIVGLNQGIPTDLNGFINKCALIEDIMEKWNDAIKEGIIHQKTNYKVVPDNSYEYSEKEILIPESYVNDGYEINLHKFATNKSYRDKVIKLYDSVLKTTFNILDCVDKLPHTLKYILILDVCNEMLMRSYKYRSIKEYYKLYIRQGMMSKNVINGISNFIGDLMLSQWLLDRNNGKGTIITIPKGNYSFNIEGVRSELPSEVPFEIRLGTDYGNATFRMWMENEVIPNLKRKNPYNKFISRLSNNVRTNTTSRNGSIVYTLPINMLPRNNNDRILLNDYIDSFELMKSLVGDYMDGSGKYLSVTDLMVLYTLIAHNGRLNEGSLMSVLEKQQSKGLLKEFHDYEVALDRSDLTLDNFNYDDNISAYIAARGKTGNGYSWVYNRDTGRYELKKFSNWKSNTLKSSIKPGFDFNMFQNTYISNDGRIFTIQDIDLIDSENKPFKGEIIIYQTDEGYKIKVPDLTSSEIKARINSKGDDKITIKTQVIDRIVYPNIEDLKAQLENNCS